MFFDKKPASSADRAPQHVAAAPKKLPVVPAVALAAGLIVGGFAPGSGSKTIERYDHHTGMTESIKTASANDRYSNKVAEVLAQPTIGTERFVMKSILNQKSAARH